MRDNGGFRAGDVIEYEDGRLDYLMLIDDDFGLGVNACSKSWVELGRRNFGDEVYAFFDNGLEKGARVVGHFGEGTGLDAREWYAANKERYRG